MKLYWTVDGYAASEGGAYRITIDGSEFKVWWLPTDVAGWIDVATEVDLASARMTASVHAGLGAGEKMGVVLPFKPTG